LKAIKHGSTTMKHDCSAFLVLNFIQMPKLFIPILLVSAGAYWRRRLLDYLPQVARDYLLNFIQMPKLFIPILLVDSSSSMF
jgi:hypothetical protein